jgi:hypothetical protein
VSAGQRPEPVDETLDPLFLHLTSLSPLHETPVVNRRTRGSALPVSCTSHVCRWGRGVFWQLPNCHNRSQAGALDGSCSVQLEQPAASRRGAELEAATTRLPFTPEFPAIARSTAPLRHLQSTDASRLLVHHRPKHSHGAMRALADASGGLYDASVAASFGQPEGRTKKGTDTRLPYVCTLSDEQARVI